MEIKRFYVRLLKELKMYPTDISSIINIINTPFIHSFIEMLNKHLENKITSYHILNIKEYEKNKLNYSYVVKVSFNEEEEFSRVLQKYSILWRSGHTTDNLKNHIKSYCHNDFNKKFYFCIDPNGKLSWSETRSWYDRLPEIEKEKYLMLDNITDLEIFLEDTKNNISNNLDAIINIDYMKKIKNICIPRKRNY